MQSVPYKEIKKYLGKVRKCSVCGNNSKKRTNSIWAKDKYFKAIQCEKCDYISVDPCITQKGLDYYYQSNMDRRLIVKKKMKLRDVQYLNDRDLIYKYIKGGSILDVGCGGGYFLSKFSNKFKKVGLDIDKRSAEIGSKNFNIKIINSNLGEEKIKKKFDLIIFRGVIEHIYDPNKAINRAYKLLKKNGLLFFCATPNASSFTAWLYRSKWNLWHPVQHINIFSTDTLWKLCGKNRFDKIDEKYEYLETPYAKPENDYKLIKKYIINKKSSKLSPPFWGSMLSLVLKKK